MGFHRGFEFSVRVSVGSQEHMDTGQRWRRCCVYGFVRLIRVMIRSSYESTEQVSTEVAEKLIVFRLGFTVRKSKEVEGGTRPAEILRATRSISEDDGRELRFAGEERRCSTCSAFVTVNLRS